MRIGRDGDVGVARMLVVAVLFVLSALPAGADLVLSTTDPAVHGERSDLWISSTRVRAQALTVGAGGGLVTNLVMQDAYVNPFTTGYDVALYSANADGTVGAEVLAFNSSPTHLGSGFLQFTPQSSYSLVASSNYWLVTTMQAGSTFYWKYSTNTPLGSATIPSSYYRAYSTNSGASFAYDTGVSSSAYGTGDWHQNLKLEAAIPEPTVCALLGFGLLTLLRWRRSIRRN